MSALNKNALRQKLQYGCNRDSVGALNALENALETPVHKKYKQRIEENYDVEGQSPCFEVYKLKANRTATCSSTKSSDTMSASHLPPQPDR